MHISVSLVRSALEVRGHGSRGCQVRSHHGERRTQVLSSPYCGPLSRGCVFFFKQPCLQSRPLLPLSCPPKKRLLFRTGGTSQLVFISRSARLSGATFGPLPSGRCLHSSQLFLIREHSSPLSAMKTPLLLKLGGAGRAERETVQSCPIDPEGNFLGWKSTRLRLQS